MLEDPRPIQTMIKHEILRKYLTAWGGIISQGLGNQFRKFAGRGGFYTGYVYVDCFAGTGLYQDEGGATKYGSPVIGIEALDTLRQTIRNLYSYDINVNVILAEKDRKRYETLMETLKSAGYGAQVVEDADLTQLQNGQIAVYKGDYREHLDQILAFTGRDYTWSLYFLDPYGADGVDLNTVRRIITQEKVDAIIYYPYLFVQRFSGRYPLLIDKMYGSKEWPGRPMTDHASGISDHIMPRLVELYHDVLQGVDADIAVKKIPLLFEDKDRIMYYLFLTTHDGTGALKMNEILDSAEITQFDYRQQKRNPEPKQQPLLFPEEWDELAKTHPHRPTPPEVDFAVLTDELHRKFGRKSITFRNLLKGMANSPYYFKDLQQAVKKLRKESRIRYEGELRNSTLIEFLQ